MYIHRFKRKVGQVYFNKPLLVRSQILVRPARSYTDEFNCCAIINQLAIYTFITHILIILSINKIFLFFLSFFFRSKMRKLVQFIFNHLSGLTKKRQYCFDVWKIGLKNLFVRSFFFRCRKISIGFKESFNRVGEMFEFFTELYYFHWTFEL